MTPEHYPTAVPADEILPDVERRLAAGPGSPWGYDCLFITATSTRPAMAFELLPAVLTSADWRARVLELVQQAKRDARGDEAVYFEPY